jgi:hypothetical protein
VNRAEANNLDKEGAQHDQLAAMAQPWGDRGHHLPPLVDVRVESRGGAGSSENAAA